MIRILLLGTLAALFFSSTFVLNRSMSLAGGHWFWSASLRYAWMTILICSWLAFTGKHRLLRDTLSTYTGNIGFWTVAGCVGFGVFYSLITFSAAYSPGWVVAATWQTTIVATPIVLLGFGKRVPLRAILFTLVSFAGVILINVEQAERLPLAQLALGSLPVLVAAFAYPFGNQLVWEAQAGGRRFIPAIDTPAMRNSLSRVLLLTLGSIPLWIGLYVITAPPPPSTGQLLQTLLVAVFSGVAATSLFLHARQKARTAPELAAADCTQSMEVAFSLLGEVLLLGGVMPQLTGWAGFALIIAGLILYLRVQNS